MESGVLDPFGDYATRGYLRNHLREKNLKIVGHLETAAFESAVHQVVRSLRRIQHIQYGHVLQVHRALFDSVYPWAGQDRSVNAPDIAIVRAGYRTLFAHPADIVRAAEFALARAADHHDLRAHPGEIFGYLAYAHPFLEGNGRTLLVVCSDLCRRAGFHIRWEAIPKTEFLHALTQELLRPGSAMDGVVLRYASPGVRSTRDQVHHLRVNFNR